MSQGSLGSEVALAVSGLGGRTVLSREKAGTHLSTLLSNEDSCLAFQNTATQRAEWLTSEHWEERLGALLAHTIVLKRFEDPHLASQAVEDALRLLIDPEVRVRLAVGHCLAQAAKVLGDQVWKIAHMPILDNITNCWDRDALVAESEQFVDEGNRGAPAGDFVKDLLQSSYFRSRPGTGEMRHGTEGWQALETSFVAMREIIEATGQAFAPHLTAALRQLLYKACRHPNRFIRETSYHTLASLCTICKGPQLHEFGAQIADCLQDGLSENWSQVRYAACVCARSFMLAAEGFEEDYFPAILPHLCFNRYDVAEGVRFYSLDTWKLVMKDTGPKQVAKHITQVVSYYVRCAKTNNHTVREAACTCLAELFAKISKAAVQPHLPKIQRTLLRALKDDSWTVRDAAGTAYAKAVLAFPDACRPAMPEIWPLWLGLLDENVFSVREHAAAALCDVVRAYGQEALDILMPILRERLPRAKEQPAKADDSPFEGASLSGQHPMPPAAGTRLGITQTSSLPPNGRLASTSESAAQGPVESNTSKATGSKNLDASSKSAPREQKLERVSCTRPADDLPQLQLPSERGSVAKKTGEIADGDSNMVENLADSGVEGYDASRQLSGRGVSSSGRTGGWGMFPDRIRSPRSPRSQVGRKGEHAEQQDELFKEGTLLKAKPKDTGGIDYSCGCMDYGFKRDREPWEASDGAVYLLAGLAEVAPAEVPPLLPLLSDVALLDHWLQARSLQTTIWNQLPDIMRNLGKRVFKPYIELFVEPLFRSLACENQLCRAAAGACLAAFRDTLGPRIFAGRLDAQQQAAMAASPDVPPASGSFAGIAAPFAAAGAGKAPWENQFRSSWTGLQCMPKEVERRTMP